MTGWLGPVPVPASLVAGGRQVGDAAAAAVRGARWVASAALAGASPLLVLVAAGGAAHQWVTATALFFLLVGAARADAWGKAAGVLAVAFVAHSAAAIALARWAPQLATAALPGGEAYWAQTRTWLLTGADPEYELAAWVPAHAQLAAAMVPLTYLSLGLIPCLQGLHEVDLMNFYVGRLLAESGDGLLSLVVGWHPWSVLRGLGFTVLTATLALWSYQRLVGQAAGSWRRLGLRLALGAALLLADGLAKFWLLEPVRVALASRLVVAGTP